MRHSSTVATHSYLAEFQQPAQPAVLCLLLDVGAQRRLAQRPRPRRKAAQRRRPGQRKALLGQKGAGACSQLSSNHG